MNAITPTPPRIATRRVHYLSGGDPRPPRYYYRLYREEARKHGKWTGETVTVGPCRETGPFSLAWNVTAAMDGEPTATDYEFVSWHDIACREWTGHTLLMLAAAANMYIQYLRFGGLKWIKRNCPGPFKCAMYPVIWVLLSIAGAGAFVAALSWLLAGVAGLPVLLAIAAAAVPAVAGLVYLARRGNRSGVFWLLRDYLFVFRWGRDGRPELEKRIRDVVAHIRARQLADPVDEVVVVGHSVGSMLAISIIADLLEESEQGLAAPLPLSLITLGHCMPLLSLVPGAQQFRADLTKVALAEQLPWTDVTALADLLGFFLIDQPRAAGADHDLTDRPALIAARFFRMFTPETYAKIRRDKLRVHFQYIMASELRASYDYFRITAGPLPAWRASREEVAT